MPHSASQVSVVIPCHNGAALTAACIESLLAQTGGPPGEILVVDNASSDETADLDRLDARVRVIRQGHNRGFAGGVNAGVKAARGDLVLVLNNDTLAATNMLGELLLAFATAPDVAAVGPVSNQVKGSAQLPIGAAGSSAVGRAKVAAVIAEHPPVQDVDSLAGLCLLVARTTFAEFGLFDERFGHGNYEDDDFSLRLRLHGKRLLIAHRAFLHHVGHATFRALGLDVAEQIDRRKEQFCAKWQHDPAGAAVVAAWRGDARAMAHHAAVARRRWPNWPDADWYLARAAAIEGRPHDACTHLRALLDVSPRYSAAAIELFEQLLAAGHELRAFAHLRWTSEHCPLTHEQHRRSFRLLGEHALERGDVAAARAHFELALRYGSRDGAVHNWLGVCSLREDRLDEALAHFQAAVEHGCAIGHTNLGITHHRRGELELAAEHFRHAAEELPDDPVAAANLAASREWTRSPGAATVIAPPVRSPAPLPPRFVDASARSPRVH